MASPVWDFVYSITIHTREICGYYEGYLIDSLSLKL